MSAPASRTDGDRTSSGAPPPCTVVIACPRPGPDPDACLDALADQVRPGDEVLVVVTEDEDEGEGPGAGPLPPGARRVVRRPGSLAPELWAAGLAEANGRVVALTSAAMVPDPGWIDHARSVAARTVGGVGGAIEAGEHLGARDWAYYFCRYAPYAPPLPADAGLEVPADNAAYPTAVLEAYRDRWADGFWEPFVHAAMRADGHELVMDPGLVVRLSAGAATAFSRQRYEHGRMHGRLRSSGMRRGAVAAAALTAPAVPFLLTARIGRQVWPKRRLRARAVAVIPLVLWFTSCWALGELVGRLDVLMGRS